MLVGPGETANSSTRVVVVKERYQGKSIQWWARHTVQARKDANKRGQTVKRLRAVIRYSPTVEESIRLATIIYPQFSEHRAWCIIRHESWMMSDPLHARNRQSVGWAGNNATGLYQFLPSTFRSTPFGKAGMSIYSAFAQSLAAGWMHANRRGGEWAINC